MIKHRTKKWNLKKNFKLEELAAVAKSVEPFVKAGLKAPAPMIAGRRVPIHRSKRHFRAPFQPPVRARSEHSSMSHSSGLKSPDVVQVRARTQPCFVRTPGIYLQPSEDWYGLESTMHCGGVELPSDVFLDSDDMSNWWAIRGLEHNVMQDHAGSLGSRPLDEPNGLTSGKGSDL